MLEILLESTAADSSETTPIVDCNWVVECSCELVVALCWLLGCGFASGLFKFVFCRRNECMQLMFPSRS